MSQEFVPQILRIASETDINMVSVPASGEWSLLILEGPLSLLDVILPHVPGVTAATSILICRERFARSEMSQLLSAEYSSRHEIFLNQGKLSQEIVDRALSSYQEVSNKKKLVREQIVEKRRLEISHQNLESEVEKRTLHIDQSHQEEKTKLSRQRELIKFMQDLIFAYSLEEMLLLLQGENRKFQSVGAPILYVPMEKGRARLLTLHHRYLVEREGDFSEYKTLAPFLANLFARPFGRIVSFPLRAGGEHEPALWFECQLEGAELQKFQEHVMARANLFSIAWDRMRAEAELASFTRRWEKTFAGMRDTILIVDDHFDVLESNREKLRAAHSTHQKCYEIFMGIQAPCSQCPLTEAENSKAAVIRSGEKYLQVYSYLIGEARETETKRYVHHYSDITIERQLYMKMVQTEKMSTLGLLAGNVAHELNNPLTGIRSLVQVLLSDARIDETLASDLREIESAAVRCQNIIRNLLNFSASQEQEVISTDVRALIQDTLILLKSGMKRHRVLQQLVDLGIFVLVEPHLLQQVIFNLVNNALQAMAEPGVLSIHSFVDKSRVFIEVCDTGPGVPENLCAKLFEPFFTTKGEGLGTGLGLSFSRSVVERFGGTLSYHENVPKGACFTIELPLEKK